MTEVSLNQREFHLVRIFPQQVHTFWEQIRETIVESFGMIYEEVGEAEIASIQSEIMRGTMQAFGVVDSRGDVRMSAIALTLISDEPILRKRSLVIVGLKSFCHIPDSVWDKIIIGAMNIARAEECTVISAVTNNEKLIELARRSGFSTDIRFCFLEIGV